MTTTRDLPQDQWWYRTDASAIEGPLSTHAFVSLFTRGYVDGLTIITNDPSLPKSDWLPLSEHPQLSEAARNATAQSAQSDQREHEPNPPHATLHHEDQPPQVSETDPLGGFKESHTSAPQLPNAKTAEDRERKRLSRKRARKAAKLRNRQNTSVYVSCLPADATEAEVATFFAKCGIILPNPETGRPRVKLYRDENGKLKGDGLVTYALRPSVENAISILDGMPLRYGMHQPQLSVKEANFDHKHFKDEHGVIDEEKKRPRISIRGRDLVEEALTWSEEQESQKGAPRIVILKNVFHPQSADYEVIGEDMKEGCEACGEMEKLTVFERNAEGAVAVKFTSVEASLKCIDVMNGRWYDGRRLHAAFYDGETDYTYKETEEERNERERKWEQWLDDEQSAVAQ